MFRQTSFLPDCRLARRRRRRRCYKHHISVRGVLLHRELSFQIPHATDLFDDALCPPAVRQSTIPISNAAELLLLSVSFPEVVA